MHLDSLVYKNIAQEFQEKYDCALGKRRLDSVLVERGTCSNKGRNAKSFLLKNEVFVNGERKTDGKTTVESGDEIEIRQMDGEKTRFKIEEDIYIAIDKPKGVVCSNVSDSHETVFEWLKRTSDLPAGDIDRLHMVGRLDSETSGLLILTTDGSFSHFLTNPESGIEKTYHVLLKNGVDTESRNRYSRKAKDGVTMPPEKKSPEEVSGKTELRWISGTECLATLTEGKFHEVRRIFRALGNEVAELRRVAIGNLTLKGNEPTQLTPEDLLASVERYRP